MIFSKKTGSAIHILKKPVRIVLLISKMEDILSTVPFSSPPKNDNDFEIGDHVEVLCDHDFEDDRVRDWLDGVVVKKGHKKAEAKNSKPK